jgi:DNA mismatch repair protein MutL
MPEIRILPEMVANQIAAGEVVERPAAVVKELLENSLDAGATRVTVEFRNGGKAFIAVEDNGCGMTPDQALMALEMHATSKLRTADDLNEIRSFGFRGEALPSIASVSRFTLRTRPAGALAGTEIFVNGGKFTHQRDTGMAFGTRIEVASLFNSVPARLKFLKADNTEAAHITRLTRLYAVAHPKVGFRLVENGMEIFRSPSSDALLDRVREIWGGQLAGDLSPLAPVEAPGMRLHGLLGKPGAGRMTRQEMVTIVNGRPVDSRTLAYALVESYHTLLPKGRYPLAFLFLEIDPHWVDVNVHPAKREIRFREEARVRNFVITKVLEHLAALRPAAPAVTGGPEPDSPAGDAAGSFSVPGIQRSGAPAGRADFSPRGLHPPAPIPGADTASTDPTGHAQALPPAPAPAGTHGGASAPVTGGQVPAPPLAAASGAGAAGRGAPALRVEWRLAGRLAGGMLLFETARGLVVLNLRAARERIWYERVLGHLDGEGGPSQQLLFPAPLELDPLAASILREHGGVLAEVGFSIEEFGRNFFRIEAVPEWLEGADSDATAFIRDTLAELGRRSGEFRRAHVLHDFIAKTAARRAGKSATPLADDAVPALLRDLFLCQNPAACPFGLPVFFELSRAELLRRLGN